MRFLTLLFAIFNFVVLHGQSTVSFTLEDMPAGSPHLVGLRGSLPPLSWEETLPLTLKEGKYQLSLPFTAVGETLEFKFVFHAEATAEVSWEGIENRKLVLGAAPQNYSGSWNEPAFIDPATIPLLEVAALQSDYLLIEEVVRNVHPGTYRYLTEAALTEQLDELKVAYSQPLSTAEAYLALNKLLASIRCGHTASPMYNQGAEVSSMLHYGKDKLPFTFRWIDERMIVVRDATVAKLLPQGAEVLTLNGVPVAEVLRMLRKYVGSDGPATDPVDGILSLRGYGWRLEAFDALFHLAFPFSGDSLPITYRPTPQGEVVTDTITTVRRKTRAAVLEARYPTHPERADDLWHLEIGEDGVAILTIGDFTGFGLGALQLDHEAFFADVFGRLREEAIEQLIIDVRENEGGNDPIVLELFSYLKLTPDPAVPFEGRMRYQSFPVSLRPYVKTWGENIPAFFEPRKGKDRGDGYYRYPKAFTGERMPKPKKLAFAGEVVFLTGRINASLGFYLANNARRLGAGTLIGETTGGCLRGINGGNLALLRLPATNLELDFPVLGGFALTPQPATGVVPDVLVAPTAESIRMGEDLVLAAARAYLARVEE